MWGYLVLDGVGGFLLNYALSKISRYILRNNTLAPVILTSDRDDARLIAWARPPIARIQEYPGKALFSREARNKKGSRYIEGDGN